jgi:hypothetical protein
MANCTIGHRSILAVPSIILFASPFPAPVCRCTPLGPLALDKNGIAGKIAPTEIRGSIFDANWSEPLRLDRGLAKN